MQLCLVILDVFSLVLCIDCVSRIDARIYMLACVHTTAIAPASSQRGHNDDDATVEKL